MFHSENHFCLENILAYRKCILIIKENYIQATRRYWVEEVRVKVASFYGITKSSLKPHVHCTHISVQSN
jgi:hypothetical protein